MEQESVILSKEGYDYLKLNRDKTVVNLKTNHVYDQAMANDVLVIWHENHSVSIPIMRYWRKYFANEIEKVPDEDKRSLSFIGCPNYIITRDGRVWNNYFYSWQKFFVSKSTGYVEGNLTNGHGCTHTYKLHRLLMMAFKPHPRMSVLEVDHLNGNKLDNDLINLEWVTTEENGRRAREMGLHRRTLTDDQIHAFCKEWVTGKYKTAGKCARALGLTVTACEHIINHGSHTRIASLYGIPYKKPVRLTPVDWSRYPKSKYLKRPTAEQSPVRTPSNCEKRLTAEQPQT